ncbi:Protease HtpX [Stieleria neptunia]|uniref:Protease HtpX n=1 Tax=Stieleria neptunia TaxID=2527979 RepID=A0A518HWP5_9BACT|nr:M48 family metalloprotease [Stieleria neptunia]QDV45261.1 Protease HtpX [Stieleria neptunia]
MQLYYFLAVILSLSLGSLPESNQSFAQAVGFTGLVILAWWVLCFLAVRLVAGLIDKGEVDATVGYDWFERQTECFRWFSLGLILLCLGGFGLGRNLDRLPLIQHSLALQSMVLLVPAIAMMAGLWAGESRFAARMGVARRGWWATLTSTFSALRSSVGWLIAPIIGFLAIIDLVSLTAVGEQIPNWAAWVALGVVMVAGIPILVRRVFPTRPIDDATKQWIQSIVTAGGIRRCKIVMWDTNQQTHNAMIAGLLGRFRVLLLSDRLVRDLAREELAMVILHEVAHAKRFHVPLRITALVPAWLLGAGLERGLMQDAWATWATDWAGTLGSVLSLVATVLILRWVSYRSEFDADSVACRLAPAVSRRCERVPATEPDARRQLASALLRVTEGCAAARKPTWLHPGIADRINAFSPPVA